MNKSFSTVKQPLVSVVITTYKRDCAYLKEALESVLAQTYTSLEIIVVDDNGEQSTYSEAVKRLCNAYEGVVYLQNLENKGAQYSRNMGILTATSEYVAFLDDDDVWAPRKIEAQMKLFEDPAVGMVYCDGYSFIDDDRENLGAFREASLFDRPITQELELFNDYIGSTSQAIIKRECFASVGLFDADMPARQDYEMWLRISKQYKIIGSPEKLLYYRKHSGERISTNWENCFKSYRFVLEKYSKELRANRYAKAKLILRLVATAKSSEHLITAGAYFAYALFVSSRCVLDVIIRHVKKIPFSEYYNHTRLSRIIKNFH